MPPTGNKQLRRKRVKLDQSLFSGYRFSEPTCCRPHDFDRASVFRAPFLGQVWPIRFFTMCPCAYVRNGGFSSTIQDWTTVQVQGISHREGAQNVDPLGAPRMACGLAVDSGFDGVLRSADDVPARRCPACPAPHPPYRGAIHQERYGPGLTLPVQPTQFQYPAAIYQDALPPAHHPTTTLPGRMARPQRKRMRFPYPSLERGNRAVRASCRTLAMGHMGSTRSKSASHGSCRSCMTTSRSAKRADRVSLKNGCRARAEVQWRGALRNHDNRGQKRPLFGATEVSTERPSQGAPPPRAPPRTRRRSSSGGRDKVGPRRRSREPLYRGPALAVIEAGQHP